jgi:hypothetical protein
MQQPDPPNFRSSYPLAGERIGPAWRIGWAQLLAAKQNWIKGSDLAHQMAEASNILPKSALNLLISARAAGILEVSYRKVHGRKTSFYRIKP